MSEVVPFEEKRDAVAEWMTQMQQLSDALLPDVSPSAENIDRLYAAMQHQRASDALARVAIDYERALTSQYVSETARLTGMLEELDLVPENLSVDALLSLHSLSSLAVALELKDTSTASYLSSIQDLCAREWDVNEALERERVLSEEYMEKAAELVSKLERVRKIHSVTQQGLDGDKAASQSKQANLPYFVRKSHEYQQQLLGLKEEVRKSGVSADVYHCELLQVADSIAEIEEKCAPARASLEAYQMLPPDISLARLKVEQERRRLAELKQRLDDQITSMHYE